MREQDAPPGAQRRPPSPPAGVVAFTAFTAIVAVAAVVWGQMVAPIVPRAWSALPVLLAVGWFSAWAQESDAGDVGLSFSSVVLVASIPLVGPVGAALCGALMPLFSPHQRWFVYLFNAGLITCVGAISGLVYFYAGGPRIWYLPDHVSSTDLLLDVGVPLFLANVVGAVVNVILISAMTSISGQDARLVVTGLIRQTAPLYIGYTVFAFLFVILWGPAGVGPLSALLILAPLFVSRWVYQQYGDEYRAHSRILDTLASASSRRSGIAVGRAQSVGAVAEIIGATLGLGAATMQDLKYAALLRDICRPPHDGPPADIRVPIDNDPAVADRRHPELAAGIVSQIGFLVEAGVGIRHHHERFDGTGFPDGLAGSDIPLIARILAVAERVTDVLSDDPDLSDDVLVAVLELDAGTAYDPELVAVLARGAHGGAWARVRARFAVPSGTSVPSASVAAETGLRGGGGSA